MSELKDGRLQPPSGPQMTWAETKSESAAPTGSEVDTLRTEFDEYRKQALMAADEQREEIDRLRKRNSELQRRSQQAEAAVAKCVAQWKDSGGPRGGSFGRALLACECNRLYSVLEQIAELNTGFSSDADKMNALAKAALYPQNEEAR